jgi:transcriptional regulator with XRE-family HTH domain
LWRHVVGDVLRRERLAQARTLKDVADAARISMPYLSELERGRKEASSEVLAAAARALGLGLADLLALAQAELARLAQARVARVRGAVDPSRTGRGGGQHRASTALDANAGSSSASSAVSASAATSASATVSDSPAVPASPANAFEEARVGVGVEEVEAEAEEEKEVLRSVSDVQMRHPLAASFGSVLGSSMQRSTLRNVMRLAA